MTEGGSVEKSHAATIVKGKLIEQVKSTQEDIVQIPFEKKVLFTKARNNSSYLTFLIKIDPGEKRKAVQKKTVFFGRIESDSHSYDFRTEKALMEGAHHSISMSIFLGLILLNLGMAMNNIPSLTVA